jgi:hypothetical protein
MFFPLFIIFSRKEKLIGVIDCMTQKEILRNSKERYIYVQSKEKLIGVIDGSSRKENKEIIIA